MEIHIKTYLSYYILLLILMSTLLLKIFINQISLNL